MESRDPILRLCGRAGLRIGIMGGAFDPIHVAHLVTAEEALRQFSLDEVVFMPTGRSPHKAGHLTHKEFRYLLVAAATAGHPQFSVSRYELDQDEICYTVDTLERLAIALGPGTELFFVTGADAVLEILSWKRPGRVLDLCTLIAATRPGHDLARLAGVMERLQTETSPTGTGRRIEVMEIPALSISSSMIRERLVSGQTVRYLVPEIVAQLIDKSCYYRPVTS